MSDAISAALAAAEVEANETPAPAAGNAGSPPPPAARPAGLPATGGAPRSLMDVMATAAMNVDFFLRVKPMGIMLGKDLKVHDEIEVDVRLRDAKSGWVIRVNTSAGVRYLNSYDGETESKSKANWAAVVADAQRMDGNAYVSDLVELPAKLAKTYPRKEGGPAEAGTVVGLSLSYMAFKAFGSFLQEVFPKYGLDTVFRVKLTAVAKVGGGQDYGIFGFEVIDGAAGDAPAKSRKAA
ncbi:hypothetical protein [Methylobacterium aquaticum]|uniref:Uncharacterized protein n=1 Tax=Methylobacterium aquaticum TaxID=270351 RepID=A0A0C6FTD8_9HYPH|nr:hypothetical protein [Methylobacterium aquaticum]BAQ50352.1 hypothetical protein Maq22A_3p50520 [Methylobacterium aquaticum]